MSVIAPDRVTRSETELHVGLDVPRNTAKQIHNWVKDQDWPAGTTLEEPSEYHVTLLYAPDGHHHKDSWWVQHLDHAKAKIDRFESFPGGPDGHPYVLRIDSPEIQEHANTLLDSAEEAGLPITRFDGGYKPHLTIGYGPQEVTGLNVPNYEFDLGPSSVSDPRPPKTPEDEPIPAKVAEQRGWTDFYHVSPRANRESIQNLGLMGENGSSPWGDPWERKNQPYGNYFYDNPQDAQNYAWGMRSRDPEKETPWEDRYEQEEPPQGFETWPEEKQDEWYDNAEYHERTEDPNGYDIWKVNTRDLPIHRDPETAINTNNPPTRDTLQQQFADSDWDTGRDDLSPWQNQLNDQRQTWGTIPRRFYTPEQVDPSRMQLHQHMPSWNMGQDEYYDRMDDPETTEQEVPLAWDEMQLRRPQFPAHSNFTVEPWDPHTNYTSATLAEVTGPTIDAIELALHQAGYPTDDITVTAAVQTAILLEKFGDPSGDLSYLLHHSGVFDDVHPWKPGMYGKGMLSPMGSPVLWATDATPGDDPVVGVPDHSEIEMKMQWPTNGAQNYFYVYPDGGVEDATLDPESTSRFVRVNPALFPKPSRDRYEEFPLAESQLDDLNFDWHGSQTRCLNCESPLVNGECQECSRRSTVPSEVMNPDDHWSPGPLGEPPDKHHDVQVGNDWAWRTSALV